MSTGTTVALFTISTLSLISSATTLGLIIFGGRKIESEIIDVRERANVALRQIKSAIIRLEI